GYFRAAAERGCDAFVTADVKYDQFLDAKELGLTLVDAGHFPTEDVVCGVVARYLAERFPELTIRKSSSHREVIEYDV
ncbi:MAG: Nif3-like dinuclear metal center hexameric protein, partial [Oscillospiraceae bacterium]|nr:Nif3-like dinuclear metal center hexameric protein [Oscillospiraceae bacterium]